MVNGLYAQTCVKYDYILFVNKVFIFNFSFNGVCAATLTKYGHNFVVDKILSFRIFVNNYLLAVELYLFKLSILNCHVC